MPRALVFTRAGHSLLFPALHRRPWLCQGNNAYTLRPTHRAFVITIFSHKCVANPVPLVAHALRGIPRYLYLLFPSYIPLPTFIHAHRIVDVQVEWLESSEQFGKRFESYLRAGYFRSTVHWFSIFNSFMMVMALCGVVAMILVRTLKDDFAKVRAPCGVLRSLSFFQPLFCKNQCLEAVKVISFCLKK